MIEGTHLGVRAQSAFGCSAEKAPLSDLFFKPKGHNVSNLKSNASVIKLTFGFHAYMSYGFYGLNN